MSKKKPNSESNPFEEQMEEFKEFQDNVYNPGHYIGTGRTPLTSKIYLDRQL